MSVSGITCNATETAEKLTLFYTVGKCTQNPEFYWVHPSDHPINKGAVIAKGVDGPLCIKSKDIPLDQFMTLAKPTPIYDGSRIFTVTIGKTANTPFKNFFIEL